MRYLRPFPVHLCRFRTFPDFLLDLTYDSLEVRGELFLLNEEKANAESWCENLLLSACMPNAGDSIDFNEDGIFSDGDHTSYLIEDTTFSISYKNLDFMKWDSADGRYKTGLSASISGAVGVRGKWSKETAQMVLLAESSNTSSQNNGLPH